MKGFALWFTGLSGGGKSTLSSAGYEVPEHREIGIESDRLSEQERERRILSYL